MTKYVAFLRAINVGGHTVKMDRLRKLFQSLGFDNVETFIASGNVIFDSASTDASALERQIEDRLFESLGYKVATFLRSVTELKAIADHCPFPPEELVEEGSGLYVVFLQNHPNAEAKDKLMEFRSDEVDFHVNEREVYCLFRQLLSQSTFSGAMLEKILHIPGTMRNVSTVRRLAAKYPTGS